MKNRPRILSLIILISFLASCAAPSETPDTGTHDTRTPGTVALDTVTPIPTETLMATITTELAKPSLGHNLSPENAKIMVCDSTTCVTKNADGLVTATWDSAKNEWTYNMENIKMQIGYVAMPNTTKGLEGAIDPSVHFVVPAEWKVPLPENNKDLQPLVDFGYLGTHVDKIQHGEITYADFGVDFRGIVLAEPAGDGHTTLDRYVACFTLSDKNHPDILYVLTMPIIDFAGQRTDFDILSNGSFTVDTLQPPYPWGIQGPVLLDILKDPKTIGRRMVISLRTADTSSGEDLEVTPDHQVLADAIQNGRIITTNLDIRITLTNLHIPHDLHP